MFAFNTLKRLYNYVFNLESETKNPTLHVKRQKTNTSAARLKKSVYLVCMCSPEKFENDFNLYNLLSEAPLLTNLLIKQDNNLIYNSLQNKKTSNYTLIVINTMLSMVNNAELYIRPDNYFLNSFNSNMRCIRALVSIALFNYVIEYSTIFNIADKKSFREIFVNKMIEMKTNENEIFNQVSAFLNIENPLDMWIQLCSVATEETPEEKN